MTLMAWLLDDNGDILASFENYESLEYDRPFQDSGSFSLKIARSIKGAELIQKGLIIGVDEPNKPAISQLYRVEEIMSTMEGDGAEGYVIEVSGRSLSGILEERICIPPVGSMHDRVYRMPAEEAMKHYVRNNLGENADEKRRLPNFTIAAGTTGTEVTYEARYQTVAEVLAEIAIPRGLGWEITYDRTTKQYVFDVIGEEGVVKSNPPIFDIELGTAESQSWLSSDMNKKNFSYVAGQGEGAERVVITRSAGNDIPLGENFYYYHDYAGGTTSGSGVQKVYDSYEGTTILKGDGYWISDPINISSVGQTLDSMIEWTESYMDYSSGMATASDYPNYKTYVKGVINGVTYDWVQMFKGDKIPFLESSMDVSGDSTIQIRHDLIQNHVDVVPYFAHTRVSITTMDPQASAEWYMEKHDKDKWENLNQEGSGEAGLSTGIQFLEQGIKLDHTSDVNIIDQTTAAQLSTGTLYRLQTAQVTDGAITDDVLQFSPATRRKTHKKFEGFENGDPDTGGTQFPFTVSGDWVVTTEDTKGDFMNAHSYRNRVLGDGQSSTVTFSFNLPVDATNRTFTFHYKTNGYMATSGAYHIKVDGVALVNTSTDISTWTKFSHTFTTNGNHTVEFQVRDTSPAGAGSSARLYIDDVELKYDADYTGFEEYGERITPSALITSTGILAHSSITWDSVEPFGTWIDMQAGISTSSTTQPSSWTTVQNGDPIPGATETGMGGKYLWLRMVFNGSPYIDKTPYIKSIRVVTGNGYVAEGTYQSQEMFFRNAGIYLNGHVTWETTSLPSGASITAEMSYDDGVSWEPVLKGQGLPNVATGDDITERSGIIRLILKKGSNGASPIVKRLVIHINKEFGGYEPTGHGRKEIFVDARDISDNTALGQRGKSKMQETIDGSEVFETVVNPYGPFKYGVDWDMGDIVIIANKHWNVQQQLRVVGVSVSQSGDMARPEMTVALGAPWPNLISRIKKLTKDGGTTRT